VPLHGRVDGSCNRVACWMKQHTGVTNISDIWAEKAHVRVRGPVHPNLRPHRNIHQRGRHLGPRAGIGPRWHLGHSGPRIGVTAKSLAAHASGAGEGDGAGRIHHCSSSLHSHSPIRRRRRRRRSSRLPLRSAGKHQAPSPRLWLPRSSCPTLSWPRPSGVRRYRIRLPPGAVEGAPRAAVLLPPTPRHLEGEGALLPSPPMD
jgi:hypothetical protein